DPTFAGNVTVVLATNPGGGSLDGTTTVQAVNGVATFVGLTLNNAGTGFTLQVSGSGIPGVSTSPFSVTADKAAHLVLTTQPPTTVTAGRGFGLVIAAEDLYGNVDSSFAGGVTLSPVGNFGGNTLGGTTNVPFSNGVAAFAGLILNIAG